MIEIITTLAAPWLKELIIGAAGAVVFLVFGWNQKRKGRNEVLEANRRASAEMRDNSNEIDDAVAGRDEQQVNKDLAEWER